MAGGKGAGQIDNGLLVARIFRTRRSEQEHLIDRGRAAWELMCGLRRSEKVNEFAENSASAGAGVGGQWKRVHLRDKRIIEIVSNDKRRLLRRSDDWSGSRGAGLAREQALVGAVAKLPKLEPPPKGRDEKNGEEGRL